MNVWNSCAGCSFLKVQQGYSFIFMGDWPRKRQHLCFLIGLEMMTGLFSLFSSNAMKTVAQHKQPPVTETQVRCEATKTQPDGENPSETIAPVLLPKQHHISRTTLSVGMDTWLFPHCNVKQVWFLNSKWHFFSLSTGPESLRFFVAFFVRQRYDLVTLI